MAIFWDVALCRLVETDRRFKGAYSLKYHIFRILDRDTVQYS
jgi:hypothetical protein